MKLLPCYDYRSIKLNPARQAAGIRALVALLVCILVTSTACARKHDLDAGSLDALVSESSTLLKQYHDEVVFVPAANWPPGISALRPEEVYVRDKGVYVVLNRLFVTQSGYFIPRFPEQFRESPMSDPSYKHLGGGVYWFEVRGQERISPQLTRQLRSEPSDERLISRQLSQHLTARLTKPRPTDGRPVNPQTGLYYYRARYYSPRLGRFLQTDPIGMKDDFNLYSYADNDVTNAIDPDGEGKLPLKLLLEKGLVIRNAGLAGKIHPVSRVPFDKLGFPIFDKWATHTVHLPKGFTGTAADAAAANARAGLSGTGRGYVWHHHQDGFTMQRVPAQVHGATGHTGGLGVGRFITEMAKDPSVVGGLIFWPLGFALHTSPGDSCESDLGCVYEGSTPPGPGRTAPTMVHRVKL